jgi:peroxiredoxin
MPRPVLLLAILALAAALAGCSDRGGLAVAPTPPDDRAPAPAFELPDLRGGEQVSLAGYRGRPLLLNFWASWCGPCIEEMPAIAEFARSNEDIAVLGIASMDRPEDSREFVDGKDIDFDLAVDRSGEVLGRYGSTGLPTTVLIDTDGRVVSTVFGPLDGDDLDSLGETLRAG